MKRDDLLANTLYALRHDGEVVPALLLDSVGYWTPDTTWHSPHPVRPAPFAHRPGLKRSPFAGYLVAVPLLIPVQPDEARRTAERMAFLPPLDEEERTAAGVTAWMDRVDMECGRADPLLAAVALTLVNNSDLLRVWEPETVMCPKCRRGALVAVDGVLPFHDAIAGLRALCPLSKTPVRQS